MTPAPADHLRLAVDIGGTFVDVLSFDERDGRMTLHKRSTTPADPARGVVAAVADLHPRLDEVGAFAHGTTLGLNAILQRAGADVGIITNEGFRDLLEIARAAIPASHMYDFSYAAPPPLVPRRHRLGVPGRMDAQGRELLPLDEDAVLEAGRVLVEDAGLRSIAVCFLHSYANPAHERRAGALLREAYPGVAVAVSSDITREYREYERTCTVVLDAYIRPVLSDYLGRLESELADAGLGHPLHIMRSGGGAMTSSVARTAPLTTVLSGPAGGVVGASFLATELGLPKVLSFDVGGTSVDACVVLDGRPTEVHEAAIDGFPLQVPIFDIRTVGAGGGSIAWVDDGLLKVGPRSAGAVPGPVAYGRGGTEPTLTDAALVLGYLDPAHFLAGAMEIDTAAAAAAVEERIARPLGMTVQDAAASVFRVLLARSVGALREITVERGLDPREFALLSFGGAGGLLAAMLAREMGIATTVIPQVPAAFSAFGMLRSDLQFEFAATALQPLDDKYLERLGPVFDDLASRAEQMLSEQGVKPAQRRSVRSLDVRYRGQEHTLPVELHPGDRSADLVQRFHDLHRHRYGHAMPEAVQVLTVRVLGTGELPKPGLQPLPPGGTPGEPVGTRRFHDVAAGGPVDAAVFLRESLVPGQQVAGPLVVEEGTATTVVFGDQLLTVDRYGHLFVRTREDQ
ncbi:hydantoinase/oxoprolinase family protein [Nakamurella endophytica]|uniref:5-oxoprolinase n=1 Tax=Nakamurella endophytica TaxID=1748367 RepID=A0A917TAW4_9ACTN|nr:hydantoinase/oxoprolinase family protein [Nakamurella endophytica]GGM15519.1 5-oxoprolinase [Nakamurella endophytica]